MGIRANQKEEFRLKRENKREAAAPWFVVPPSASKLFDRPLPSRIYTPVQVTVTKIAHVTFGNFPCHIGQCLSTWKLI